MRKRTHKRTMRLPLITIGVLALVLAVAGMAAAAGGPPPSDNGSPEIDKKVFIHYGKGHQPARGGNGGGGGSCKVNSGGQKWFTLPVDFEVNSSGSGTNAAAAVSAVETGFQAWEGALAQDLVNSLGETNLGPSALDDVLDGHNVQAWADLSAYGYDSGVIAVTIYWYYVATGEIFEFDVANNTQYTWAVHNLGGADPNAVGTVAGSEDMDVQNIGAHEAGHALAALNDMQKPGCAQATMFAYSDEGEVKKRSLEQSDIDVVNKVYAGSDIGDDPGGTTGVEYHSSLIESVVVQQGRWHNLTATLTIRDPDENLASQGSTVAGRIFRDGRTFSYLESADSNGQVRFKLRHLFTDTVYTVIVDDVDDGSGSTVNTTRECHSRTVEVEGDGTVVQGGCSPGTGH